MQLGMRLQGTVFKKCLLEEIQEKQKFFREGEGRERGLLREGRGWGRVKEDLKGKVGMVAVRSAGWMARSW